LIVPEPKQWWQKPGIGIMYQIEARPGWEWNRNYDKFSASLMDGRGRLKFNGPFCKIDEWVAFSRNVGVDYHVFEAKWHDGICYFDSKHTSWKTPVDYCKQFSEASKHAAIPFMYYYSNIFDHNPQFNDIQPLRSGTSSFIGLHSRSKWIIALFSFIFTLLTWRYKYLATRKNKKNSPKQEQKSKYFDRFTFNSFVYNPWKYEKYLFKQLAELIEKYRCDGLWMDWYQVEVAPEHHASADAVMQFMERKYPNTVLTFNFSLNGDLPWVHYLSHEAHGIDKAWEKANKYRKTRKPWELVSPAGQYWDNPETRADPLEDARIAAVVMASGGKSLFGMPSLMNGDLHAGPRRHLEILGNWYASRRGLFIDAVPMAYAGNKVPGVSIDQKRFGTIGARHGDDALLHVINFTGKKTAITLEFDRSSWKNVKKIVLEPREKELPISATKSGVLVSLIENDIDRIDTILRISDH